MRNKRRTRGSRGRELHAKLLAAIHSGEVVLSEIASGFDPCTVRDALLLHCESPPVGGTLMHAAAGVPGGQNVILSLVTIASRASKSSFADSFWLQKLLHMRDLESGWTPLHVAMYKGRIGNAVFLMHLGASACALDCNGEHPIDLLRDRARSYTRRNASIPVACSCTLPRTGEVFAWGSNASLQIGTSGDGTDQYPRRVSIGGAGVLDNNFRMIGASSHHASIATADRHSLFASSEGRLRVVGTSRFGALGLGQKSAAVSPTVVHAGGLDKVFVVSVAACATRSAAISACGVLYVWGKGESAIPRRVFVGKAEPVDIRQIVLADKFWIAVDQEGGLWGCGSNDQNVLALDSTVDYVSCPRRLHAVGSRGRVRNAYISRGHSSPKRAMAAALFINGDILLWGGTLGHSPRRVVLTELLAVQRICAPRVVDVAIGDGFVMLLTSDGRTFVCCNFHATRTTFATILPLGCRQPLTSVVAYGQRIVAVDQLGSAWEVRLSFNDKNDCFVSSCKRIEEIGGVRFVDVGKNHAICTVLPFSAKNEVSQTARDDIVATVSMSKHQTDPDRAVHSFFRRDAGVHLSENWSMRTSLYPFKTLCEVPSSNLNVSSRAAVQHRLDLIEDCDSCRKMRTTEEPFNSHENMSRNKSYSSGSPRQTLSGMKSRRRVFGSLQDRCEEMMFRTCTVSSALEMLKFAVDHSAFNLINKCLDYMTYNLDRCVMTRIGLESLLSLNEDHVRVLEIYLRGDSTVRAEEQAACDEFPSIYSRTASFCSAVDQVLRNFDGTSSKYGGESLNGKGRRERKKSFAANTPVQSKRKEAGVTSLGRDNKRWYRPSGVTDKAESSAHSQQNSSMYGKTAETGCRKSSQGDRERLLENSNLHPPRFLTGNKGTLRTPTAESATTPDAEDPSKMTSSDECKFVQFAPCARVTDHQQEQDAHVDYLHSRHSSKSEQSIAGFHASSSSTMMDATSCEETSTGKAMSGNIHFDSTTQSHSVEFDGQESSTCQALSSRASHKKARRRTRAVLTMGSMQLTKSPDVIPGGAELANTARSLSACLLPISPAHGPVLSTPGASCTGNAWGIEAKSLSLRQALHDHAETKSRRLSFTEIQAEQEECWRTNRQTSSSPVGSLPGLSEMTRVRRAHSSSLVEGSVSPGDKGEPDFVRDSSSSAGLTVGAFIPQADPVTIPRRKEHRNKRGQRGVAEEAEEKGAWSSLSKNCGDMGQVESPRSFRDIQTEEEEIRRHSGGSPSRNGSPREVAWMMLPGDRRVTGKNLKLIEMEERAMKEIRKTIGTGTVRVAGTRHA